MTYAIRVIGLDKMRRALGQDFRPTISAATLAIAKEIEGDIAPYPPSTVANSPSNPTGHWYERGYGPRWRTRSGEVRGRQTSQTLGRRWAVVARGVGAMLSNAATYAGYVQRDALQAAFHRGRGWKTDKMAVTAVVQSGRAKAIIIDAIRARLRGIV